MSRDLVGEESMCLSSRCVGLVCVAIVAAFSATSSEIACAEPSETTAILQYLALGKPGDHPIGVHAWYEKEPGHVFQTGDRVILSFQTDQEAHVMVLHVIPCRSVQVLFPNKEHADAAVRKGAVNTLFGDDSGIRLSLGEKIPQAQLVFCVSSKPFVFGPLKRPSDQVGVTLRSDYGDARSEGDSPNHGDRSRV